MTGLSDELVWKKCIFDLPCNIDDSFHYFIVAHNEKVQSHKRVGDVARSPLSGFL